MPPDSPQKSDEPGSPDDTYAVTLLYQGSPPDLRAGPWRAALPARVAATPTGDGWLLADSRQVVTTSGGKGPALSVVMPCAQPPDLPSLAAALTQTWTWPGAAGTVADLRSAVYVGELTGRLLPREHRLAALLPVITGIVRATRPAAVLWRPAGYLAEPRRVLEETRDVLVNVRMFRIEETGAVLLDTMGLAPLGLPDLQCQASHVRTGRLAAQLRNLASYLLEHGDVIRDGHTVEGSEPGSAWRVSRRGATAEPARQVLDLDPGPSHAA
jgi:hypothetical protein